jgi:hypothetical protein
MMLSLPKEVQEKVNKAFNEKEVFHTILNLQKNQPIRIVARTRTRTTCLKFVEYAYKQGSDQSK